jgi:hypothetical protein
VLCSQALLRVNPPAGGAAGGHALKGRSASSSRAKG